MDYAFRAHGEVGETRTDKQNLCRSLLDAGDKRTECRFDIVVLALRGMMVITHGEDRKVLRKCAVPTVETAGKIQKASLKDLSLGYGEMMDYQ
ncbi:unnamed protein product [Dovyalis caffra]|uniref:Uncharacterized protein n=1 Tax=Dovyalis caffra TaxID=77055 RepID=A0AAV1S9H6_9ROSI|nr:unnamed protein product [Dovyalis caffra]